MTKVLIEKGELQFKKEGDGRYGLKVNDEWHGIRKPQDENAQTTLAAAWRLCKEIANGDMIEIEYEQSGKYRDILGLSISESKPKQPQRADDEYWQAKDRREDMRSALHAAVASFPSGESETGVLTDRAKAFYRVIREAD